MRFLRGPRTKCRHLWSHTPLVDTAGVQPQDYLGSYHAHIASQLNAWTFVACSRLMGSLQCPVPNGRVRIRLKGWVSSL